MKTNIVMPTALKLNGHRQMKLTEPPRHRLKISWTLHDQPSPIPIKFAKPTSARMNVTSSRLARE
jgi:hypothetical protein